MKQVAVQSWLEHYCRRSPGVASALVLVATDQAPAKVAECPRGAANSPSLLVAAQVAQKTGQPIAHAPPRGGDAATAPQHVIALPLRNAGRTVGAVAIGLDSNEAEVVDRCGRSLRRAVESLGRPSAGGEARSSLDAGASLRLLAAMLGRERFSEAAAAAATELATLLRVDRTSIGWLRGDLVEVVALSHGAEFDPRRDRSRAIAAAMDEAIAQREIIGYPQHRDAEPRITLMHAALAGSGEALCTVPLVSGSRVVGALLLEGSGDVAADADARVFCEHASRLIGQVLELTRRAELPWRERLREGSRRALQAIAQRRSGPLLATTALAAVAAALLVVPVTYRIGAPAQLEGATQRALVAPADGFLQAVHVRAGDAVGAEQLLVELADQDLTIERRKWESELAQHENAYGAALARADRAQLVIHQAKVEEARSQLELTEQRLARSRVVAPFDGVVIKGDLNQSLGSPVKRGELLLAIAPKNDFRIIVRVDERDIADVRENQSGTLLLTAAVDAPLPIRVERITPAASARDGRNFFEVEAKLIGAAPPALRPGLEGIARIDAGTASTAWIWSRRILDWLRLTLWAWGL